MNDQEIARDAIALGRASAQHACTMIDVAIRESRSTNGLLARALIELLEQFANNRTYRDNLIEGFCDEVQRFRCGRRRSKRARADDDLGVCAIRVVTGWQ